MRCASVTNRSLSWLIRTNKASSAVETTFDTYAESTPAVDKAASSVVMSAARISMALSALLIRTSSSFRAPAVALIKKSESI